MAYRCRLQPCYGVRQWLIWAEVVRIGGQRAETLITLRAEGTRAPFFCASGRRQRLLLPLPG